MTESARSTSRAVPRSEESSLPRRRSTENRSSWNWAASVPKSCLRTRIWTRLRKQRPLGHLHTYVFMHCGNLLEPGVTEPLQHGQICMSTERIIVDETVIDQFAERLADIVRKTTVLPGASTANTTKVATLITDAIAQGARPLLGGSASQQDGSRLAPQILTNVTRDMEIWRTETFGPVAVLVGFKSVEEAIDMANDSDYGLSASIFTADTAKALHIARLLDSGAVHINSTTIHDEAHAPHGGAKASGWGRFGVPWGTYSCMTTAILFCVLTCELKGFAEFTQLKTITIPSYRAADL